MSEEKSRDENVAKKNNKIYIYCRYKDIAAAAE